MSLSAEKMSPTAFSDLLDLIDIQPWLRQLHGEMVDLWNLCETRAEQILLKSLLTNFVLFDGRKEARACIEIANVVTDWKLDPKSTWVVAVADSGEIDGSVAGMQKLKNKFDSPENWHSRFVGSIPVVVPKVQNNNTVVLFDDFIGSGAKLVRKQKWLKSKLEANGVENVEYRFLAYSAMKFGMDHIVQESGCLAFAPFMLQKGISESFPDDQVKDMLDLMLSLESRLGVKYKQKSIADFSLGFGKSESLYCAENDNCPNNVFPIFWWPNLRSGIKQKTLFTRVG